MRLEIVVRWMVVAAGVGVIGCGSSKSGQVREPTPADDLAEVAAMLREFSATTNRAPAKLADLNPHRDLYPRGYAAIQNDQVVVVWNAAMPADGSGGATVVAYEKKAEAAGGAVLFGNGEIKTLSATDLQAAKAK